MIVLLSDTEIINLFFARSERAIAALSQKYGSLCRQISKNILGSDLDAEECVNDAFLGIWNSIPPLRPEVLSSYLCRIVRNLSVKRYHANSALKRRSCYDVALDELESCLAAADTTESVFDAKELTCHLNAFLASLDRTNRIIFVRRYWYADPICDIAAALNLSQNNVSVRLSRLRKKLCAQLRKEGFSI